MLGVPLKNAGHFMVLTPLETFLLPFIPVCILLIIILYNQTKKVRFQHEKIVELINKQAKPQTEELSEFLEDFKHYGYSFVRVNPGSVFQRIPRE